jgi:guanylate kinase
VPLLFVLSGPSGVGKDSLLARMKARGLPLHFAVTAATRPPRPGEKDGQDYYFLSLERFMKMRDKGELLEWAQVYGHWYGVPKAEIRSALSRGEDVMMKVDVQGADTIRGLLPQAVSIFLVPPSPEELQRRLASRQTEGGASLELRLCTAREEMKHLPLFDYVVINDDLGRAAVRVEAIITAENCRVNPRRVELP